MEKYFTAQKNPLVLDSLPIKKITVVIETVKTEVSHDITTEQWKMSSGSGFCAGDTSMNLTRESTSFQI